MAIITIDGPAGSGKTTLARELSKKLHIHYISTGLYMRGFTVGALISMIDETNEKALVEFIKTSNIEVIREIVVLNGVNVTRACKDVFIASYASKIGGYPKVWKAVRDIYDQVVVDNNYNAIVEGRGIGSEVYPQADLKIYLDCSIRKRAVRRHRQFGGRFDDTLLAIQTRDDIDRAKKVGVLKQPANSIYVDTTETNVYDTVDEVLDYWHEREVGNVSYGS